MLNAILSAGMLYGMGAVQKVTVHLPKDLLRRAQESTGEGLTATVRRGLELLAAAEAQRRLLALRGKVKFSINLDTLREDRA